MYVLYVCPGTSCVARRCVYVYAGTSCVARRCVCMYVLGPVV